VRIVDHAPPWRGYRYEIELRAPSGHRVGTFGWASQASAAAMQAATVRRWLADWHDVANRDDALKAAGK
jgi:hypothetical protein